MASQIPELSLVMLAGGDSTRMGSPKHLLPFPDGRPSYQHNLEMLHEAFPEVHDIYLALHTSSQSFAIREALDMNIKIVFGNSVSVPRSPDRPEPARSMLAAYRSKPNSHWLVIPCDEPLLTIKELRYLRSQYRDPVTCFESSRGILEPLVAIWSPQALARLEETLAQGRPKVDDVVEEMRGFIIRPLYDHSLFNANTKEDWDHAMQLLGRKKKSLVCRWR